jgi:hypothetical protein
MKGLLNGICIFFTQAQSNIELVSNYFNDCNGPQLKHIKILRFIKSSIKNIGGAGGN